MAVNKSTPRSGKKNHEPTTGDAPAHEQQKQPERLSVKDQDPAAQVIDVARAWRRSFHRAGYEKAQVASMFDPNAGMDGGSELLELIDELRATERPANEYQLYEARFLQHIQVETALNEASGRIDEQKLKTAGDLRGEKAIQQNVRTIQKDLETQRDKAEQDGETRKQRELEHQIDVLTFFLGTGGEIPSDPAAEEYVSTHRALAEGSATEEEAQRATANIDDYDKEARILTEAWEIIADNKFGRPSNRANNTWKLGSDSQLDYRAVEGYSKAGKEQERQRAEAQVYAARAAARKRQRDAINKELYGYTEKQEFGEEKSITHLGVVDKLAKEKSKIIRNNDIGKRFMRWRFGNDVAERKFEELEEQRGGGLGRFVLRKLLNIDRHKKIRELEDDFARLTHAKSNADIQEAHANGEIIGSEEQQLEIYSSMRTKSMQDEVYNLRSEITKRMQETRMARLTKALSSMEFKDKEKRKRTLWKLGGVAVAGVGLGLMTGGIASGVVLAGSAVTAAKIDSRTRGLPEMTKRLPQKELLQRIDREVAMQRARRQWAEENGEPTDNLGEVMPYRIGIRELLKQVDKDTARELGKRVAVVGGFGAVGLTALGVVPSVTGFGSETVSHASSNFYNDTWRPIADSISRATSDYMSTRTYI